MSSRAKRLSRNLLVDNVRRALDEASLTEFSEGVHWYQQARDTIACTVSRACGVDLRTACGVVAALSPGCFWDAALRDAHALCQARKMIKASTYRANVRKALAIIGGAHPAAVLGRKKVWCFYHNLWHAAWSPLVTVDRHALRVAVGKWVDPDRVGKIMGRVMSYSLISEAYQEVADACLLLPSQVQAVTWLNARNRWKDNAG